ncbi:MAG: hypothetical protein FWD57_15445 [Polyangiaceae bacterium]|nr:hypothetical protein [Polyangiaceae bacterium]
MSAFAQSAASIDPMELLLSGTGDMKISTDLLTIEKVWVDSCHRSATRPNLAPIGQCDRQPSFERALVRAVIQGAECMPEKPKDETVSFALEINHSAKTTRLFPGRSGSLGVTQSKPVVACVLQKFAEPAWDNAPRDHSRYVIGVLARYHAQKRQ